MDHGFHCVVEEAMDLLGTPFPIDRSQGTAQDLEEEIEPRGEKERLEERTGRALREYRDLEERCVDVAAKRAVEAYRKRGMPVPPVIPARPQ